jgi:hypothetical protein
MESVRTRNPEAALMSLEAAAASARGGFACMFSSSEEFETALISERRAQGRYDQRRTRWPAILFVGCSLMVVGTVLLFNWAGLRDVDVGRREAPFSFGPAGLDTVVSSVPIASEPKIHILILTRFLHANRYPLRSKTLCFQQEAVINDHRNRTNRRQARHREGF